MRPQTFLISLFNYHINTSHFSYKKKMFSFLSSFEPLSQLIVLENAEPELQRLRCYCLKWCRLITDSSQISASGNGLKYGMSHTHAHHSAECAVHVSEPMRPVSPCFWLTRETPIGTLPFLFHGHHELEVPLGWPSEGTRHRAAALGAASPSSEPPGAPRLDAEAGGPAGQPSSAPAPEVARAPTPRRREDQGRVGAQGGHRAAARVP